MRFGGVLRLEEGDRLPDAYGDRRRKEAEVGDALVTRTGEHDGAVLIPLVRLGGEVREGVQVARDLALRDRVVLRLGLGKGLGHGQDVDVLVHPDMQAANEVVAPRGQRRSEADRERGLRWRSSADEPGVHYVGLRADGRPARWPEQREDRARRPIERDRVSADRCEGDAIAWMDRDRRRIEPVPAADR